MALMDPAELAPLLACPRCRSPLRVAGGEDLRCRNDSCGMAAAGPFRRSGRWPVLVDFERSILDPGALPTAGAEGAGISIERVPAPLRRLWKPSNRVAARNVQRLLELLPGKAPRLLVVGGGTVGNGIESLYSDRRPRLAAFDLYGSPQVQLIADAHRIPLADGSFDAVVVQAVLEHVLEPERVVAEIHRVLRSDGLVYAETPFLQPVHAGSHDFTRYTSSGHRQLFRAFEEIDAGPVAGPGSQLLASLDHLVRGLLRSQLAGRLARAALFWLRYLDRLVPPAYAMDDASAYYFLGRRSERELTPRQIIAYYRGAQRPR
jgi:SAM-dependent methyltransferase